MTRDQAKTIAEEFINRAIDLFPDQTTDIYLWSGASPHIGVRCHEVSISNNLQGLSWGAEDSAQALAICAQAERLILAHLLNNDIETEEANMRLYIGAKTGA